MSRNKHPVPMGGASINPAAATDSHVAGAFSECAPPADAHNSASADCELPIAGGAFTLVTRDTRRSAKSAQTRDHPRSSAHSSATSTAPHLLASAESRYPVDENGTDPDEAELMDWADEGVAASALAGTTDPPTEAQTYAGAAGAHRRRSRGSRRNANCNTGQSQPQTRCPSAKMVAEKEEYAALENSATIYVPLANTFPDRVMQVEAHVFAALGRPAVHPNHKDYPIFSFTRSADKIGVTLHNLDDAVLQHPGYSALQNPCCPSPLWSRYPLGADLYQPSPPWRLGDASPYPSRHPVPIPILHGEYASMACQRCLEINPDNCHCEGSIRHLARPSIYDDLTDEEMEEEYMAISSCGTSADKITDLHMDEPAHTQPQQSASAPSGRKHVTFNAASLAATAAIDQTATNLNTAPTATTAALAASHYNTAPTTPRAALAATPTHPASTTMPSSAAVVSEVPQTEDVDEAQLLHEQSLSVFDDDFTPGSDNGEGFADSEDDDEAHPALPLSDSMRMNDDSTPDSVDTRRGIQPRRQQPPRQARTKSQQGRSGSHATMSNWGDYSNHEDLAANSVGPPLHSSSSGSASLPAPALSLIPDAFSSALSPDAANDSDNEPVHDVSDTHDAPYLDSAANSDASP
ncbi:hypothetical protein DL89DRAFT_315547 [Linderina pennispora]|uniref:Uncharacterized protein n=1 Tax=Linderina pennispora TaxID=61395 RepID=A0A1Y1WC14_9FUNG|nr:uncharacterized protein DL89DRAFT_315547 [Linderina pennispora]ORX70868.1 hypothetical protein DL89DRAFT_315547 [Linderina pennispora]